MELWNLWWPVGLVVLADVFYQVCARRLSSLKSPLAALGMTYLVSACLCALLLKYSYREVIFSMKSGRPIRRRFWWDFPLRDWRWVPFSCIGPAGL